MAIPPTLILSTLVTSIQSCAASLTMLPTLDSIAQQTYAIKIFSTLPRSTTLPTDGIFSPTPRLPPIALDSIGKMKPIPMSSRVMLSLTSVCAIHATKYKDITEADDGRLSLAKIDAEIADAEFHSLINAGCNDGGDAHSCIIHRFCDSCTSDVISTTNVLLTSQSLAKQKVNTYDDAIAGTNKWVYCNYNDAGIGFSRDCNKDNWAYGSQWNSYVVGGATANHHGFYVEKP
eukprot:scaffold3087_cov130-Alexandrium_tamarense.AAC.11